MTVETEVWETFKAIAKGGKTSCVVQPASSAEAHLGRRIYILDAGAKVNKFKYSNPDFHTSLDGYYRLWIGPYKTWMTHATSPIKVLVLILDGYGFKQKDATAEERTRNANRQLELHPEKAATWTVHDLAYFRYLMQTDIRRASGGNIDETEDRKAWQAVKEHASKSWIDPSRIDVNKVLNHKGAKRMFLHYLTKRVHTDQFPRGTMVFTDFVDEETGLPEVLGRLDGKTDRQYELQTAEPEADVCAAKWVTALSRIVLPNTSSTAPSPTTELPLDIMTESEDGDWMFVLWAALQKLDAQGKGPATLWWRKCDEYYDVRAFTKKLEERSWSLTKAVLYTCLMGNDFLKKKDWPVLRGRGSVKICDAFYRINRSDIDKLPTDRKVFARVLAETWGEGKKSFQYAYETYEKLEAYVVATTNEAAQKTRKNAEEKKRKDIAKGKEIKEKKEKKPLEVATTYHVQALYEIVRWNLAYWKRETKDYVELPLEIDGTYGPVMKGRAKRCLSELEDEEGEEKEKPASMGDVDDMC